MRRTYRYRLYPTRRQVGLLEDQLDEACNLYNSALQHRRDMWRDHQVSVSYYDQSAELKTLRASMLMNGEANFWSQQAVLRRLDRAFQAFFRRVKAGEAPGYPRFRSRRRFDTLEWMIGHGAAFTDAGRLRLQAVGHVKIKLHRPLPPEAKLCTAQVSRCDGRWYVFLSLKDVAPRPLLPTSRAVGLDLGITTFAATSDGELIPGPRAGRTAAASVRRAQRKVTRRRRGSNRRRKAARLLARAREREANIRRDHAHKTARSLIEHYEVICVEDLNIRGLARSRLARDVHDQGWASFIALLEEKAEDAARQVIKVDPKYTSQICSACGEMVPKSLGERIHSCECGYTEDRDINAAKNILARGIGPDGAVRRQRWGDEARAVA